MVVLGVIKFMKKFLVIVNLALVALALTACEPRFDCTSKETMQTSGNEIVNYLAKNNRTDADNTSAFMSIMLATGNKEFLCKLSATEMKQKHDLPFKELEKELNPKLSDIVLMNFALPKE